MGMHDPPMSIPIGVMTFQQDPFTNAYPIQIRQFRNKISVCTDISDHVVMYK